VSSVPSLHRRIPPPDSRDPVTLPCRNTWHGRPSVTVPVVARYRGAVSEVSPLPRFRRLTTPRAAAVAGILFALLFAASLVLVRSSIPDDPSAGGDWVHERSGRVTAAMSLMPFAGIAFLWFVGVVRDRMGELEDRFFSTVFFGSALLFLAMVFVSMSIAGAILASSRVVDDPAGQQVVVKFGRYVMLQISNVYALRMAGVFIISLATVWLRTGVMPRWIAVLSYLVAFVLLVVTSLSLWFTLVFPAWALVVSLIILFRPVATDVLP
jgi:hypothetical protein